MKLFKQILCLLVLSLLIVSQSVSQTSMNNNEAKMKSMMEGIYKAWENNTPNVLDKYIAADCVDHSLDPAITKKQGLTGIKEWFTSDHKAFSNMKIHVNAMAISGNKLLSYYTFSGTNTGMFMGKPATNKSVKSDGVDIVVYKDGKFVEHWAVMDRLGVMKQLGMIPPSGSKMKK